MAGNRVVLLGTQAVGAEASRTNTSTSTNMPTVPQFVELSITSSSLLLTLVVSLMKKNLVSEISSKSLILLHSTEQTWNY
jgi:hypothetical protein